MISDKRILVLMKVTQEQKEELRQIAPAAQFLFGNREEITRQDVQSAQIILGNPDVDQVTGSENLQLLQLTTAGCEAYVAKGVLREEVILANATGIFGQNISEYMLAVTLMHFRNLHLYRDNQKVRLWRDEGAARSVSGAVALVIGAGDIGSNYGKLIKFLGGTTIGIRRTSGRPKPDSFDEVYTIDRLDEMIPLADVVALSLPNTPQTVHIIDAKRLAAMKKNVLLINVGRGNAIDTEALCSALDKGLLGGVGLDVTDPEPLPQAHRLWSYPKVTITPHNTGGKTVTTSIKCFEICKRNLQKFLNGERIDGVDRSTGYRVSQP